MTESSFDPAQLRIVTPGVTPEEVAALTAVLTAAMAEHEEAARSARTTSGPDGWARSQRALRGPLDAGSGAWRSFSA
ncbi:acyl-CoA carboxylase epsilon subunit [Kitasatospora herbaricolor]|uniref:acyl-CoA carboxylase epsilon subunit n=1 Tax=Kitasatospora herbaricolor TaxID=68217 RepID=UPI0036DA3359